MDVEKRVLYLSSNVLHSNEMKLLIAYIQLLKMNGKKNLATYLQYLKVFHFMKEFAHSQT